MNDLDQHAKEFQESFGTRNFFSYFNLAGCCIKFQGVAGCGFQEKFLRLFCYYQPKKKWRAIKEAPTNTRITKEEVSTSFILGEFNPDKALLKSPCNLLIRSYPGSGDGIQVKISKKSVKMAHAPSVKKKKGTKSKQPVFLEVSPENAQ